MDRTFDAFVNYLMTSERIDLTDVVLQVQEDLEQVAEEVERAFESLAELHSRREALERFLELFDQQFGVPVELQDNGACPAYNPVEVIQTSRHPTAFLARRGVYPAQPLGA